MVRWSERIVAYPEICQGKPRNRGSKILVSVVIDDRAEGMLPLEIVQE